MHEKTDIVFCTIKPRGEKYELQISNTHGNDNVRENWILESRKTKRLCRR